jgi:hypothetical protein
VGGITRVERRQAHISTRSEHHQLQILEKLSNLEDYLHSEQLPPPALRQGSITISTTQPRTLTYERVAVRATQRKAMCDLETCGCACHGTPQPHDQQALRKVLGSIFAGYTGQPSSINPCSERRCRRGSPDDSGVTYYFPRWWVATRMLSLVANMTAHVFDNGLPPPPRIVPAYARIFRHAAHGENEILREMFAAGLGSPTDTDAKTGATPLHVCSCHSMCLRFY